MQLQTKRGLDVDVATIVRLADLHPGEPADPLSLRPPLRQAVLTDGTTVPIDDPAMAGPPIARAPNDVGGLLDPSKGWTLNIQKAQEAPAEAPVVTGQLAAR